MKRQLNDMRVNNRKGFTLIETMISLIITVMVISLIMMVMNSINKRYHQGHNGDLTAYLRVLESDNYQFELVRIKHDKITLFSPKQNKQYEIYCKKEVVQMTSQKGGYVPLLDNVNQISWQYHHRILTTSVTMNSGQHLQSSSLLELRDDQDE